MVSSAAVTGTKEDVTENQIKYFERVKDLRLNNTALIGFGISNRQTFQRACQYSHGAIVGSAFINLLAKHGNSPEKINKFISSLKNDK